MRRGAAAPVGRGVWYTPSVRQLFGFTCLFLAGCGDVAGWQARHDARAAELVARQQRLEDVARHQQEADALREELEPLMYALTEVPVRPLAAALVEEQASGYLEEQGDKKRAVLEGPGPPAQAARALALAADRVPALRIDEVALGAASWKVVALTETPPPRAPGLGPAPLTGLRTGSLETATAALEAQIQDADERLGTPLSEVERGARLLTWAKATIQDGQRLLNLSRLLAAAETALPGLQTVHSVDDDEAGLVLTATFVNEAAARAAATSWTDGVSVRSVAQKGPVVTVRWGATSSGG